MVHRLPVSDRILVVLFDALEREAAKVLPTYEIARRSGVSVGMLAHAMPVLLERGHLDPRTRSGTLKLSDEGVRAARQVFGETGFPFGKAN